MRGCGNRDRALPVWRDPTGAAGARSTRAGDPCSARPAHGHRGEQGPGESSPWPPSGPAGGRPTQMLSVRRRPKLQRGSTGPPMLPAPVPARAGLGRRGESRRRVPGRNGPGSVRSRGFGAGCTAKGAAELPGGDASPPGVPVRSGHPALPAAGSRASPGLPHTDNRRASGRVTRPTWAFRRRRGPPRSPAVGGAPVPRRGAGPGAGRTELPVPSGPRAPGDGAPAAGARSTICWSRARPGGAGTHLRPPLRRGVRRWRGRAVRGHRAHTAACSRCPGPRGKKSRGRARRGHGVPVR